MSKGIFAPTDLTKGSVWKGILSFTLPMLIGNMAQQLYSTVDMIVLKRYAENSDIAISSIGSVLPILNMFLALFIGIAAGAGVMAAQYFGAKNRDALSYTVGNCITATAASCVVLIALVSPFVQPILVLLNTPSESIQGCYEYLMISLIGIAGLGYYNVLSGVIRGLGDSITPLVFLVIGTVLNIGLDIWFVAGFKKGVAGVALATVISQVLTSVMCLVRLAIMKSHFDFGWKYIRPKAQYINMIAKLGLPSGATQAIFSSAMIVVQSLTNSFGASFVAANVIIMRVDGFAMMPNFSFGTALTTFAGQNVGAGKYDRVIKGAKQGTLMAVGISAGITVLILLFGKYLMGLFTETTELVNLSYRLMKILAVGYIAMAVTQSLSGIMRGAGDTLSPMIISIITTIAVRIPVAYGIAFFTSPDGVLNHGRSECIHISLLCSWVLGAILTVIFYRIGKWKKKSIA